ncbi:MAG TPA: hypothetical protein VFV67_05925 [Actinophytocola sp.]|uniref:hypothetical protein n=1 Tax=Actinophytocola sp. TaxID=1872138 RepID=UPI002DC03D24|nr:hypothetical protein [Actinophytocola sp.]HEU5470172.1 hypothetical protein [Actinophytocola sp.]
MCGAVLAGDERFVATAQVWRSRLGGAIPDAWPLAVLGLIGLTDLLPRMPVFWAGHPVGGRVPVWYAFRDSRARRRAVEWLADNSLTDDKAATEYLA